MNNKSKNRKNLLVKMTGISGITALFLLAAIVIFSVISVLSVRSSSMETAVSMGMDKLAVNMSYLEDMISNEYGALSLRDGKLVGRDSVSLENQYQQVDKLSSKTGIVATIFVKDGADYRRISTSIVDEAGKRTVGTYLGKNSAAYADVHAGRSFSGEASILGRAYITYYKPIFASDYSGDVIGLLFIGTEMTKIDEIISNNTSAHIYQIFVIGLIVLLTLIIINTVNINLALIKPVQTITAIINRLSMGDINQQIEKSKKQDEVGTMKNELKQLIDGLKHTADFAQEIGKGNLNAPYDILSDADILGKSLLEMRKNLQNAENERRVREKDDEYRNWATEGLARFAEILRRDNDNLETLSQNVISHLVKYLGANQGGIFILNDGETKDDLFLEMKACYAYDRRKFVKKQVRFGEGLVGTCYLEGEAIYMTDVPNSYITITSGLGEANPGAILICPLKVNDVVYGVVELASFREFEPYQRDFIAKLSESIASTIGSVKVNIRTNKLLTQTKLQAEEMANQEEELRQNMEEMHATQEEMRRRETELLEIIKKMSEVQTVAEENKMEMI
jgi:methyl-accepting chemotaxis protein/putative methionine-R-sulfoxide reductase with GAF domain